MQAAVDNHRKTESAILETYIYLKDVRIHAYHGVLPQEKSVGADFVINLSVKVNIDYAMLNDTLDNTVSYAALFEIVKQEMSIPSNLVENAAYRIIDRIHHEMMEVEEVRISMMKENPPMGADCKGAGVELCANFAKK